MVFSVSSYILVLRFSFLLSIIFSLDRVNITSAEEMLLLESYYSMYLAGVPEDLTVPGLATNSIFFYFLFVKTH